MYNLNIIHSLLEVGRQADERDSREEVWPKFKVLRLSGKCQIGIENYLEAEQNRHKITEEKIWKNLSTENSYWRRQVSIKSNSILRPM